MPTRSWTAAGLPDGTFDALAATLPASRLWSLLMDVAEARAARRGAPDLAAQWARDRFVQPSIVDQRTLVEIDRRLLGAAAAFEAVELSPVAPLGVCSVMGRASQHKVLTALRGTEVVADPTNVMALECARRLRQNSTAVRLATSHRCVRAQELPAGKGMTASFRMFCLASAGIERQDHGFVVDAVGEHIQTMLAGMASLGAHGFAFPDVSLTILATAERGGLGDRIASAFGHAHPVRAALEHPYYSGGLRFRIDARATGGDLVPLADGGAFDWAAALTSNRRAVFVASGFGSQLAALLFRSAR